MPLVPPPHVSSVHGLHGASDNMSQSDSFLCACDCVNVCCHFSPSRFHALPPHPPLRTLALFWYFVALIVAAESIPSIMDVAVELFVTALLTFTAHAVYCMVPAAL